MGSYSYYKITENELLEDYLKAVPMLTISSEHRLQNDMEKMIEQSKNSVTNIELQLYEKEKAIATATKCSLFLFAIFACRSSLSLSELVATRRLKVRG
jgi:hypothetical protein